jgi:hypothetical protein
LNEARDGRGHDHTKNGQRDAQGETALPMRIVVMRMGAIIVIIVTVMMVMMIVVGMRMKETQRVTL